MTLAFKNAALGAELLTPPINWLDQINAQKDFKLTDRRLRGSVQLVRADHHEEPDRRLEASASRCRTARMRYCNMTNGGPVFVYVKDDKIVRMTPIDFDDKDPAALDDRGARHELHAAAQARRWRRTGRTPSRSSIRPTGCSIR